MKLLIADSNHLRAQAFSDFLLSMGDADLEIPVLCFDAHDLLELIAEEHSHIVFIDIDFGGNGLELGTKIFKKHWPYVFWYFTAERPVDTHIPEYIAAGAAGVISSPIDAPKLFGLIRSICKLLDDTRKTR